MAKRQWRNDMSQEQKDKIAMANKGKTLSQTTKNKISKSLENIGPRYYPNQRPPTQEERFLPHPL